MGCDFFFLNNGRCNYCFYNFIGSKIYLNDSKDRGILAKSKNKLSDLKTILHWESEFIIFIALKRKS